MMQSTVYQDYQIALELRRSCWYAIASMPVLIGVCCWVSHLNQNFGVVNIISGTVFFMLSILALSFPLRWKLRIDQNGVSRRLFLHWDFWSWADLASGRVCKSHRYVLHDSRRAWGHRKMNQSFMSSDDIREVISVINSHYQLPPPPIVPDTLILKYGFHRSVIFDNKGVHVLVAGTPYEFLWNEIEAIHITRMDPMRRDFHSLEIILPGLIIDFKHVTHQFGTSPTWHGASAELINECLFQNAPNERIQIEIAGERLTKRESIEQQLNTSMKNTRGLVVNFAVMASIFVGLLIWMAIEHGVLRALSMAAMFAIYPGSVVVFVYRSNCKHINELKGLLGTIAKTEQNHWPVGPT
jgi:hypothetical protein